MRIHGRPLFLIYRAELLDEPKRTVDALLRKRAQRIGLGELHVSMVLSFNLIDPRPYGCDSAVEFVPHGSVEPPNIIEPSSPEWPHLYDSTSWEGTLVDYNRTMHWALAKAAPDFPWFRSANARAGTTSPRRGPRRRVFTVNGAP